MGESDVNTRYFQVQNTLVLQVSLAFDGKNKKGAADHAIMICCC